METTVSSHARTFVGEDSEQPSDIFVAASGELQMVRVGEILAFLRASYIVSSVSDAHSFPSFPCSSNSPL